MICPSLLLFLEVELMETVFALLLIYLIASVASILRSRINGNMKLDMIQVFVVIYNKVASILRSRINGNSCPTFV
ncbi:hypothetical protein PL921460082 [Planktothrix tepida PCC 9214]|uniref:Uncharacterized protein n=1 Tax=Planktothrix tepida PCC 9214 TaxID=671072 RepID=A0A1J1LN25_9CYAN|nr:hypothetical protein PL921460082 [Planktothrix tepida PCC 9214]